MKVKLLVFAAALLMLTSLSFAQPFVACVYNDGFVLTNSCEPGGAPLADGTPVHIYYDANSNGPGDDQLATVCANPPDCPDGPPGTVNFNTFELNGDMMGMGAGYFLLDPCFVSSGLLPVPARYYFVITLPSGLVWTSSVMTFVVGPQDVNLTSWTCFAPPPPSCTPLNQNVVFGHDVSGPQNQPPQCAVLCHQYPVVHVCIPGLDGPNHVPTVVFGTCTCGDAGVASGYDWAGAWVYDAAAMTYCRDLVLGANGTEGSVCLVLEYILASNVSDVKALPLDNAVSVSFKTASETNVSHFEVRRDGNLVARLDATGDATAHDYSFVDNSAVNGTTYHYTLVMVNADNSTESFTMNAVTPSMDHAIVTEYALHQNFPNPFNPTTSIRFDLVEDNFVTLKVYNANGQEVGTVVNSSRKAGVNVVNFDASNLTSGLYFYTVKVGNVYSATKKMLLVK